MIKEALGIASLEFSFPLLSFSVTDLNERLDVFFFCFAYLRYSNCSCFPGKICALIWLVAGQNLSPCAFLTFDRCVVKRTQCVFRDK